LTLPCPSGLHVTVTPLMGLPDASVTLTISGAARAWPTAPYWPSPETRAIPLASPDRTMEVNGAWIGAAPLGTGTCAWPCICPACEPRVILVLGVPSAPV